MIILYHYWKLLVNKIVSVHRTTHLLFCRALEVQEVRLRILRLASAAPCKRRNLLDLAGKIQFRENYDYKALREGK
jgi:hypothetical protein